MSDALSKWIAYVCEWTPSLLPPPLGTISGGRLPIAHKVTPAHLRRLYPSHSNYNIHMGTSYDYYSHSSWFAIRPFKWLSSNLNISTWPLHDDLREYPCHLCGGQHVMEPLAQLALCPSADPILQLFLQAWPQPFNAIAQQWWSSSPHNGDKRNFVRTLVPLPLHRHFRAQPLLRQTLGAGRTALSARPTPPPLPRTTSTLHLTPSLIQSANSRTGHRRGRKTPGPSPAPVNKVALSRSNRLGEAHQRDPPCPPPPPPAKRTNRIQNTLFFAPPSADRNQRAASGTQAPSAPIRSTSLAKNHRLRNPSCPQPATAKATLIL